MSEKADTIHCDFPSNVQTIAGSPVHFLLFEQFCWYFRNANPSGISRKALCVNLHFSTKEAFFGMCASFQGNCCQEGGRKGFYLGHGGVNTEYPHLLSREEEFSCRVIRAAEHTNNGKSKEREREKQNRKYKNVFPLIEPELTGNNPLHLLLLLYWISAMLV